MALLSLVVLPAKALSDGRNKVRISVAHNGLTRYIVTNVIIDHPHEWRNGQVVRRSDANIKNALLRKTLATYENALCEMYYADGLSCPQLVEALKQSVRSVCMTVGQCIDEMIEATITSKGTMSVYKTIRNRIVSFSGENKLMRDVTNAWLMKFIRHMEQDMKLSGSTIRTTIAVFSSSYLFARRNGYVKFDRVNPFEGLKCPPLRVGENWLDVEDVRAIRDYEGDRKLRKSADVFMLSYYLGGINYTDLRSINFKNMHDTLSYTRKKVARRWGSDDDLLSFEMPSEAWDIIVRYMMVDGHLNLRAKSAAFINRNLSKVAEELGVKRHVTLMSARKSFAQHAFDLEISERVIDKALGHIPAQRGSVMHHYIRVTDEMVSHCIRRVIDNLNRSEGPTITPLHIANPSGCAENF